MINQINGHRDLTLSETGYLKSKNKFKNKFLDRKKKQNFFLIIK